MKIVSFLPKCQKSGPNVEYGYKLSNYRKLQGPIPNFYIFLPQSTCFSRPSTLILWLSTSCPFATQPHPFESTKPQFTRRCRYTQSSKHRFQKFENLHSSLFYHRFLGLNWTIDIKTISSLRNQHTSLRFLSNRPYQLDQKLMLQSISLFSQGFDNEYNIYNLCSHSINHLLSITCTNYQSFEPHSTSLRIYIVNNPLFFLLLPLNQQSNTQKSKQFVTIDINRISQNRFWLEHNHIQLQCQLQETSIIK